MGAYGWYEYTRPDGSVGRALKAPTFAEVRQSVKDMHANVAQALRADTTKG